MPEEHNYVRLIGNLVADGEVKKVGADGDLELVKLRLGVSGPREASFFDITVWEPDDELKALAKGQRVKVEGRLRQRSWETDEDPPQRRYAIDVVAETVEKITR